MNLIPCIQWRNVNDAQVFHNLRKHFDATILKTRGSEDIQEEYEEVDIED